MRAIRTYWAEIALMAVFFFLCLVAVLNSSFGLDNLELARTFSSDEATLIGNVTDLTLYSPGELYYGNGYRLFIVGFLYVCKWLGYHIDTQFGGMALRLQSLFFGAVGVGALFLILRELKVSRTLSLLGAMFVFTIPDYFHWSQTAHPDTLQTALILVAFLIVLRQHTFRAALWGSSVLGFACGSKFGGMLLLPFIFLPYLLSEGLPLKPKKLAGELILFLVPFTLAFVVLIPYGITHPMEFAQRFKDVRGDMWGVNSFRPYKWVITIFAQAGICGGLLYLLGMAFYGNSLLKTWSAKRWNLFKDHDFVNQFTLLITPLCSLAIIMAISRAYAEVRYTYFFLMLFITMVFYGLSLALDKRAKAIAIPILVLLILVRGQDSVRSESVASKKPIADEVVASNYLLKHYPLSVRILKEWYAYVSPEFTNVKRDWFLSKKMIDDGESEFDLVVLARASSGRYAWMTPSTSLKDKKFVRNEQRNLDADAVQALLTHLVSPESKWRLVYEGPEIVVFERKGYSEEKRIGLN